MPFLRSKQEKLSNVVAIPIQTGFQARGQVHPDPQGNYNLLQVKNTSQNILYYIRSAKLDKISIPEKKRKFMAKYLMQEKDVLYLSKLKPMAFRYTGSIESTVPVAHFYILRPKINTIDADYLCWVLNQGFMKPHIQKCLRGTVFPFIPKNALMELKIPLPNMGVQKKIVNVIHLKMREKEIQEKIRRKKNILIDTVLNRLL